MVLFLLFILFNMEFAFSFHLSTIYFTIVNVICFIFLQRILKKEGRSIKQLIDFRSERIGKDILYSFFWLFVFYILFFFFVFCFIFFIYFIIFRFLIYFT